MSILIVDDTASQRLRLSALLKSEGYNDLLALSSAEELFERLGVDGPTGEEIDIDLILMDISMPDIDGIEACRRIKATAGLQDIPVIMVTASTEADELDLALAAGAMDYISKPVNKSEMLSRVRSALQLKQAMEGRKACEQQLAHLMAQVDTLSQALAAAARGNYDPASLSEVVAQPDALGQLARLLHQRLGGH